MSTAVSTLALDGVRIRYGSVLALDVDELSVGPGITGLVGVNGAGKTSLFNALVGLVRPETGSVFVGGHPVSRRTLREVRRRVGLAPQQFRAPGNLAVEDLVTYLGWLHGLAPAEPVSAPRKCWIGSGSPRSAGRGFPSCPVACSAGSRSPRPWCTTRRCCSSTSRRLAWTPSSATRSATSSPQRQPVAQR